MMEEPQVRTAPARLVFLAAPDDILWCRQIDRHLYPLLQRGLLSIWSSLDISGGTEWRIEIERQCSEASFLVLLLSVSFLADPLCFFLMEQALARPSVQVLPVLLHPVLLSGTPLAHMQVLPADGQAIVHRKKRGLAFYEIAEEISRRITGEPPTSTQRQQQTVSPVSLSSRDKDRQAILRKLHLRYDQALGQALQENALFSITFQKQPALLHNPANALFRHLPQDPSLSPEGTSLVDVYDQSGGELLILGEAGAGKSTLLLHMAQGLLTRADQDEKQLLPIIFHLASWAEERLPFADWLVKQLYTLHYDIPSKLRRQWIDQGQILPLLDGLDEVPLTDRAACIEAINVYRRDYLVPLVVCGRTTEYLEQPGRLVLQNAVLLKPLTPAQVIDALNRTHADFAALRLALPQNTALQELASSPFLLNVMMVTYRGMPTNAFLQEDSSPVAQQQQLFARYLHRTLSIPTKGQRQPSPNLLSHLIWLAQRMRERSQAAFYLERLPANWLNSQRMRQWYFFLAMRLPGIIIGCLIGFAVDNLFFQVTSLIDALLLGAALGGIVSAEDASQSIARAFSFRLKEAFIWSGIGFCAGILSEILQKWLSGKLSSIMFLATIIYGLIYAVTLWFWSFLLQHQKGARFSVRECELRAR
jgi:energy-coupling factor transporter ATP-binding protein EcfA2